MADVDPNQQTGYQQFAYQQQPQQQPQQPYQGQPQPVYQQPYQPAPVPGMALSGAQKAAWFFIGMFVGIAGILVASMANMDKPYRSDCTKWAAIGCFFWLVVMCLFMFGGCTAALFSAGYDMY